MSVLAGPTWMKLGLLVLSGLVLLFLVYMAVERDPAEAGRKTAERAGGFTLGAGGAATAAAAVGAEVVLQLPELLITFVGIGAIVGGFSWEVFAAIALTVYVLAEAVNGGPRGA